MRELPRHPVPPQVLARHVPVLRVDGLVGKPLTLTRSDLAALPRCTLRADFTCEEGWSVEGLRWSGVRLNAVLALAGPRPSTRWIRICAGAYAVPLSIRETAGALLAEAVDGRPLSIEEGGPWRLLLSGGACFTSVKWVDRLEACAEPGEATGERIARARLSSA